MAKKCDVFISFKAEEINEAIWVRATLESHGISCWMAPDSIPGGSSYVKEISKAIKRAKVFVLLVSAKAQDSLWISKEIDAALNEEKIIMPFLIEECEIKDSFSFYLSGIQMYMAYNNKKSAIDKMITEIKAITTDKESAVFSDDFLKYVSATKKKTTDKLKNILKSLTPYRRIKKTPQLLPFNIITAIGLLLFTYIFIGLSTTTDNSLFSFTFAFVLFILMWNLGVPFAKLISKCKYKFLVWILSVLAGIFLFFFTLFLGALFAEIMSDLGF